MSKVRRRFSTGLRFLDQRIGGGLAAGSLLALAAPPFSQSELLLAQLLRVHPTVYVTTTRPEAEVRDWAAATVESVEDLTVLKAGPEELVGSPGALAEVVGDESVVIVDTVNGLERASRSEYLAVLNRLRGRLAGTDSVGVLHAVGEQSPPRQRSLTLKRADTVWQLEVQAMSRDLKTRLLIPKARFGHPPNVPIPLVLSDRVRIDTSRSIA